MTVRRQRPQTDIATVDAMAFDAAVDHIERLAARLHAVLALHRPRSAMFGGVRCFACRERWPCRTARTAR
jgi:hypothetical protein